jgi:hypothetical protein
MKYLMAAMGLALAACANPRSASLLAPSTAVSEPPRAAPWDPPRSDPYASLPFDIVLGIFGYNADLADGDKIEILGIRGDRRGVEEGGRYCVWGRYTLRSASGAVLRIASKRMKAGGSVLQDDEDVEHFGEQNVAGVGEFRFCFTATKELYRFSVEFYALGGGKRLGWISLGKSGC